MSQPFDDELSHRLAQHAQDAAAVPEDAVAAAQQRLRSRLAAAPRRAATRPRVWKVSAAAAVLALAVCLPWLSGGSDAFAAVQARLRDFVTLQMDVTQRYGGEVIATSRTVVDAQGRQRTDVGSQISIIVDPRRGRVLTLMHDTRQAMLAPIPVSRPATPEATAWLDELRDFRGQATLLPDSRMIGGKQARGWSLVVRGQALELWADADGLPLEMRHAAGAGLQIDYRFTFDQAIALGLLSSDAPAGYALSPVDED